MDLMRVPRTEEQAGEHECSPVAATETAAPVRPSLQECSDGLRLFAGLARPKKQAQYSVRLEADLMARLDRIVAYGEWVGDPTINRSEITRKALTVFVENFEGAAPGIEEMPLLGT